MFSELLTTTVTTNTNKLLQNDQYRIVIAESLSRETICHEYYRDSSNVFSELLTTTVTTNTNKLLQNDQYRIVTAESLSRETICHEYTLILYLQKIDFIENTTEKYISQFYNLFNHLSEIFLNNNFHFKNNSFDFIKINQFFDIVSNNYKFLLNFFINSIELIKQYTLKNNFSNIQISKSILLSFDISNIQTSITYSTITEAEIILKNIFYSLDNQLHNSQQIF